MPAVDLSFPLIGESIPFDHGYALYGSLSRLLPELHGGNGFGVHPVRGQFAGNRVLQLQGSSRLCVRVPVDQIAEFLPLAGQSLCLDGHRMRVGVPQVFQLRPVPTLAARLVTIKGFMEPEPFLEAASRQLQKLGMSPTVKASIPTASPGQTNAGEPARRVVRIKDKTVVGFPIRVEGLNPEESILIQEQGIGGRRHMGCGVFAPTRTNG